MAQGDSPTGICNAALVALGEDLIASFTPPDGSKAGRLCATRYDPVRRMVLRATPWSCAKALAVLSASATTPAFGWGFQYQVPADFLRLWSAADDGDDNNDAWNWSAEPWEMVGNTIQTDNAGPLNVLYIRDLTDCTIMDALLVQAIGLHLAADIGLALTGSMEKVNKAKQDLAQLLPDARLVTSQESSPQEYDADVWLRARNS